MSIIELRRGTDQRLQRILTASHPAAIESRANSFQTWTSRQDRYPVVAAHLSDAIWTVPSVLRDDPSVLIDLHEGGGIALDILLEWLAADDKDGFVPALVSAFTEHWHTDDLVDGLTVLALGMATRLGGCVWFD